MIWVVMLTRFIRWCNFNIFVLKLSSFVYLINNNTQKKILTVAVFVIMLPWIVKLKEVWWFFPILKEVSVPIPYLPLISRKNKKTKKKLLHNFVHKICHKMMLDRLMSLSFKHYSIFTWDYTIQLSTTFLKKKKKKLAKPF